MKKKFELACLIDDDPITIFCTKRIIELANFCERLLVYTNGREALDSLKVILTTGESLPDVILLDIAMPIMDGWQFLDEVTVIPIMKSITIYIITSSIDPADTERVRKYESVNNYIIKPITMAILKDIMNEI